MPEAVAPEESQPATPLATEETLAVPLGFNRVAVEKRVAELEAMRDAKIKVAEDACKIACDAITAEYAEAIKARKKTERDKVTAVKSEARKAFTTAASRWKKVLKAFEPE